MPPAVFVTTVAGEVELWDPSAESLFGWSAREAMGREVETFLSPGGDRALASARAEALERGSWVGELRLLTRGGAELGVRCRIATLGGGQELPKGLLFASACLDEEDKIKHQLARAGMMDALAVVARGVGHDLNNVLANVLLYTDLLRGDLVTPESRDMLASLERSVQRGISIVRQLMALASRQEGETVAVNLKYIVNGLRKLAGKEFPATINVVADYPEKLWLAHGEPGEICQKLIDVCRENAATSEGFTLTLTLENTSYEAPGEEAGSGERRCVALTASAAGWKDEVESPVTSASETPGSQVKESDTPPKPPRGREILFRDYYPAVVEKPT